MRRPSSSSRTRNALAIVDLPDPDRPVKNTVTPRIHDGGACRSSSAATSGNVQAARASALASAGASGAAARGSTATPRRRPAASSASPAAFQATTRVQPKARARTASIADPAAPSASGRVSRTSRPRPGVRWATAARSARRRAYKSRSAIAPARVTARITQAGVARGGQALERLDVCAVQHALDRHGDRGRASRAGRSRREPRWGTAAGRPGRRRAAPAARRRLRRRASRRFPATPRPRASRRWPGPRPRGAPAGQPWRAARRLPEVRRG